MFLPNNKIMRQFGQLRKLALIRPSCVLCDAVSDVPVSLCTACQQDLPWILHACERCSLPLAGKQRTVCQSCEDDPPVVDNTFCALHYSAPINYLIKRLKFSGQFGLASIFARLIAQQLRETGTAMPDAILPVPLHTRRLRTRGFNQAHEIARGLSKELGLPILNNVHRAVNTKAQSGLGAKEREQNMRTNVFTVNDSAQLPERVVIIDDVVTTGLTTNVLAGLLKQAGVAHVSVWAVARAASDAEFV